jgi:hypothetical protein
MSARMPGRGRRSVETPTGAQTEFPPPPAILVPPEIKEDRFLQAEILRRLKELTDIATQLNLDRAVRLAQMPAARDRSWSFFKSLVFNITSWLAQGMGLSLSAKPRRR